MPGRLHARGRFLDDTTFRLDASLARSLLGEVGGPAAGPEAGQAAGLCVAAGALVGGHLRFDAADPAWADRDRVLAEPPCASLARALERLLGSPGQFPVQAQAFEAGVGQALAERMLAARYGRSLVDHRVWVLCTADRLATGAVQEAAWLAGAWRLGRLGVLAAGGEAEAAGVAGIAASGWTVRRVAAGDAEAVESALSGALRSYKPTLVLCVGEVGVAAQGGGAAEDALWQAGVPAQGVGAVGAPLQAGVPAQGGGAAGAPWQAGVPVQDGTAEGALRQGGVRAQGGRAEDALVQGGVQVPGGETAADALWRAAGSRRAGARRGWLKRLARHGSRAAFTTAVSGRPAPGWQAALLEAGGRLPACGAVSTLAALKGALAGLAAVLPDLAVLPGDPALPALAGQTEPPAALGRAAGRLALGMGGAQLGVALHGGLLAVAAQPAAGHDQVVPGLRAAAMAQARLIQVLIEPDGAGTGTGTGTGVGPEFGTGTGPGFGPGAGARLGPGAEAGLGPGPGLGVWAGTGAGAGAVPRAGLAAMRNLLVFRPADRTETLECLELAVGRAAGPSVMLVSDAAAPVLAEQPSRTRSARGGYVVAEARGVRGATLVASGRELHIALGVRAGLAHCGVEAAVVSLVCWELFALQEEGWREAVLGTAPRIGLEWGGALGWERWLGEAGLFVAPEGAGVEAQVRFVRDAVLRWLGRPPAV